jgi:hypothetical protein
VVTVPSITETVQVVVVITVVVVVEVVVLRMQEVEQM